MPQVDLETLVCGGGDGKVVCETLINGGPWPDPPTDDPDLPAESFRVPIDDEIDWVNRNAAFYDRDDSTKGITNPKSQTHSNPSPAAKLHSNSQRLSANLKPKVPIIGVPKLQNSGYLGSSVRKTGRNSTVRIFPKNLGPPNGKSAVPESEPGSPKVSCFGKVLSERERELCRIPCRVENLHEADERTGFWAWVLLFSCCGENREVNYVEEPEEEETERSRKKNPPEKAKVPIARELAMVAPDLGGMKRFASGRRAASWGGDVDLGLEGGVEVPGPLDPKRISGRRSVGALEDVESDRDLASARPAPA